MQHDTSWKRLRLVLGAAVCQMVAESMEDLSHSPYLASANFQKKRIEEISKKDSFEDFQKFFAILNIYLFTFVRWLGMFLHSRSVFSQQGKDSDSDVAYNFTVYSVGFLGGPE
jgi:hypothetical protein